MKTEYDVIIIGAGLTGLHQLHRLRELGMSVRLFEAGGGVGGTWYWNRYPGARLDSESYTYAYSFSDELLAEWQWQERFASQPELERYFNYAADKFGLKSDIQFNARVSTATWLEDCTCWELVLSDGTVARSTFLITAIGILSAPNWPSVTGLEDYKGEYHHTATWPNTEVEFAGKRVAVIGTGASGVQLISEVGPVVETLTVFQRTPNWLVPLRNSALTSEEQAELKTATPAMFDYLRNTVSGFIHVPDPISALEVSPAEREAHYEALWAQPGFAKVFGNYHDIALDLEANATYASFVSGKVRERVHDPAVAVQLIPTDHPIAVKRVPCETNYFEVYNQDNVELVSTNETPIVRYTETGIHTADGRDREFDMIIFATGFDAFTGAFERIDFTGVAGQTLKDKWKNGPITNLGLQISGFPNLFTEVAPHNKGGTCNIPRCSEQNVDWVTNCLSYLAQHGYNRMEATEAAEELWLEHVSEGVSKTLLPTINSYVWGSNVAGKVRAFVAYIGTLPDFRARCDEVAGNGYEGFVLSTTDEGALSPG